MQRALFFGESQDAGHDAHGADGDALGGEREAAGVTQDVDRVHHGVVIVERLAHAHEHDVSETV